MVLPRAFAFLKHYIGLPRRYSVLYLFGLFLPTTSALLKICDILLHISASFFTNLNVDAAHGSRTTTPPLAATAQQRQRLFRGRYDQHGTTAGHKRDGLRKLLPYAIARHGPPLGICNTALP